VLCWIPVSLRAQEARGIPTNLEADKGEITLNSSQFQAGITSETALATLAKQHVALGDQVVTFGFSAKSEAAKFFILGSVYAEAVAYLHSGNLTDAAKRLAEVEQELISLQAPNSLYNYLSKTRNMLERQQYPNEVLTEFLALLQPLFDDYARSQGEATLILFRAGTWLIDMGLTAAAQDTARLQQPVKARYFRQELQRLNVPKGVMEALEQMTRITEKPEITGADATEVLRLVKRIQDLLA
jgi:hypothetical protein